MRLLTPSYKKCDRGSYHIIHYSTPVYPDTAEKQQRGKSQSKPLLEKRSMSLLDNGETEKQHIPVLRRARKKRFCSSKRFREYHRCIATNRQPIEKVVSSCKHNTFLDESDAQDSALEQDTNKISVVLRQNNTLKKQLR